MGECEIEAGSTGPSCRWREEQRGNLRRLRRHITWRSLFAPVRIGRRRPFPSLCCGASAFDTSQLLHCTLHLRASTQLLRTLSTKLTHLSPPEYDGKRLWSLCDCRPPQLYASLREASLITHSSLRPDVYTETYYTSCRRAE